MRFLFMVLLAGCTSSLQYRDTLPEHIDLKVIDSLKICESHQPDVNCVGLDKLDGHFVVDPQTMEYLLTIKTLEVDSEDSAETEVK